VLFGYTARADAGGVFDDAAAEPQAGAAFGHEGFHVFAGPDPRRQLRSDAQNARAFGFDTLLGARHRPGRTNDIPRMGPPVAECEPAAPPSPEDFLKSPEFAPMARITSLPPVLMRLQYIQAQRP